MCGVMEREVSPQWDSPNEADNREEYDVGSVAFE